MALADDRYIMALANNHYIMALANDHYVLQLVNRDNQELAKKRTLCTEVDEYPFFTKIVFRPLGGRVIRFGHPLFRLVEFLEKYEKETLFTLHDQNTSAMRKVLGYQPPYKLGLPLPAAELVIQPAAYDRICSLFTVYRLLDFYHKHEGLGCAPIGLTERNEIRPRRLTMDIAKNNIKIPQFWERLQNWPQTLREARKNYERHSTISKDTLPHSTEDNPHIGHLTELARSNVITAWEGLANNFRVAAMHLAFMLKMPGMENDGKTLPDIPDDRTQLFNIEYDKFRPAPASRDLEDEKIKDLEALEFLSNTSSQHLRVPLQLALGISPICLVWKLSLHKKGLDRRALFKVAQTLGNARPRVLMEVERAILTSLLRIALSPEKLMEEIGKLVKSEIWQECESLDQTDEAVMFFAPSQPAIGAQLQEIADPTDTGPSKAATTEKVDVVAAEKGREQQVISSNLQEIVAVPQTTNLPIADTNKEKERQGTSRTGTSEMAAEEPGTTADNLDDDAIEKGQEERMETQQTPVRRLQDIEKEREIDEGEGEGNEIDDPIDKGPEEQMEAQQTPVRRLQDIEKEKEDDEEEDEGNAMDVDSKDTENKDEGGSHKSSVEDETMAIDNNEDNDTDGGSHESSVEDETMAIDNNQDNDTDGEGTDSSEEQVEGNDSREEDMGSIETPARELRKRAAMGDGEKIAKASAGSVATPRKRNRSGKFKSREEVVEEPEEVVEEPEEVEPEVEVDAAEAEVRDYIDVDLWAEREITLDVEDKPPKFTGKKFTAYGPTGEKVEIEPRMHDKETLKTFEALWEQVEAAYQDGKPLHLSNPEESGFHVMPHEDHKKMKPAPWLKLVETKHVIIFGRPAEDHDFETALLALGTPCTVKTVQDHSILEQEDLNKRCREGTFAQIIKASLSPDGKVVNCLDIGLVDVGLKDTGYSSNVAAIRAMSGQLKTSKGQRWEDVNWALAATSGAFHHFHIDCDGFMTFIYPICGGKIWIIARPHKRLDYRDFASGRLFLPDVFDATKANEGLWTLEAIYLKPGDTLVMRPNTPHAVLTPTASVVQGGHCYATSTLPDTLVGIVHAFMAGELVTNTRHPSSRLHLQTMIDFFHLALVKNGLYENDVRRQHVPDIQQESGHRQLLAICVYGILINVLDFDTYRHPDQSTDKELTKMQEKELMDTDLNAMTYEDRRGCMYTRGQSLEILAYIEKCFEMKDASTSEWKDLKSYHEDVIVQQCKMLLAYKMYTNDGLDVAGAPGCKIDLLFQQVLGLTAKESLRKKLDVLFMKNKLSKADLDMALPELGCQLVQIEPRPIFKSGIPVVSGRSQRDVLYLRKHSIKKEERNDSLLPGKAAMKRRKLE